VENESTLVDRKGSSGGGGEGRYRVSETYSGSGDDVITEAVFITGHGVVKASAAEKIVNRSVEMNPITMR
jgi:hypothetical protein